jgi:hypothetical protein
MSVRLTESLLRQIIREEVSSLTRRRRMVESAELSAEIDNAIVAPPRGALLKGLRTKLGDVTSNRDRDLAVSIASLVFGGAKRKKITVSQGLRDLIMRAQEEDPAAMDALFNAARQSTKLATSASPTASRPATPSAPPTPRASGGLTVKDTLLYAPSDRTFMGKRATITGTATPAEEIAVECQGWFDSVEIRNAKRSGVDAVTEKILNLREFQWQAKKRGLEATPELAAQVAKIFIDYDLT